MTQQIANYDEEIVGANHPTKADTVNRGFLIQHVSDGSHALIGLIFGMGVSIKDADEIYVDCGSIDLSGSVNVVTSRITKQLTSLSTSTVYHIYVKPASDLSLTATEVEYTTTAPTYDTSKAAGYHGTNTTWRWIGWVRSDGSSNLEVAESVHSFNSKQVGELSYFLATETEPYGWIELDGSAVSRTTYAKLFQYGVRSLGTAFGVGDGSTTFTLPDLRGRFLRVWANGSANDPDRATRTDRGDGTTGDHPGTLQADQNKSHNHTFNVIISASGIDQGTYFGGSIANTGSSGGNQANPKNIGVAVYCRYEGRM